MFRIRQRCSTNMEARFNLLKEDVVTHVYPPSKHMHVTCVSHVRSKCADISMWAIDHEEADNRICLHVYDALNGGTTTVLVITVGTYVVVILVGIYFTILPNSIHECSYGTGKHFR